MKKRTETSADQVWRVKQDSSDLTEPRVLIRAFVQPGQLAQTIDFYERLQETHVDAKFTFPEKELALAVVGGFLIIEGSEQALAPFRSTTGTLLVADVQPYYDRLVAEGAEIIFPLQEVPTGAAFNARHLDGTVVEYVHHRPTPAEKG